MHSINMKWILKAFEAQLIDIFWSCLPSFGFSSQKKVDQIATQGFSNLLIRQAVYIYHWFNILKVLIHVYKCPFYLWFTIFCPLYADFNCKHSTRLMILKWLNNTKQNNKFSWQKGNYLEIWWDLILIDYAMTKPRTRTKGETYFLEKINAVKITFSHVTKVVRKEAMTGVCCSTV